MRGTTSWLPVVASQLDFMLPGVAGDFSSLDWSRWATKIEQVASLWFVLTHSEGIAPLSEEHALQFTPHSPGSSRDQLLVSRLPNAAFLAIGQKAAPCQKRYDSSFCGEQLTRRGELLGLLQVGWSPRTANAPGLPRAPSGVVGIPRTPTGKPILFGTCAPAPRCQRVSSTRYVGTPCLWQHCQVCYATGALIWVTANCMLQSLSTLKSPSVVFCSLTAL